MVDTFARPAGRLIRHEHATSLVPTMTVTAQRARGPSVQASNNARLQSPDYRGSYFPCIAREGLGYGSRASSSPSAVRASSSVYPSMCSPAWSRVCRSTQATNRDENRAAPSQSSNIAVRSARRSDGAALRDSHDARMRPPAREPCCVESSKVSAVECEQDPSRRRGAFELSWVVFAERMRALDREHVETPRPQGFD